MTGVGSTNGAWWSDLGRPLVGYQIRAADHWVFENTDHRMVTSSVAAMFDAMSSNLRTTAWS